MPTYASRGDISKPEYFHGSSKWLPGDLWDVFNYSDAARKALNDIVIILPQPVSVATTKRLSGIFTFKAGLANYSV